MSLGGTAATGPPSPPITTDAPARKRRFTFDSRFIAPLLITSILLMGHLTYGILEDYRKTVLAILAAILMEVVLGLLFTRRVPHLASAYITGISVGILVRSPEWWPYALCSMISITSKYVIRVKGRHLWNPSNLGIAALLFLAPMTVASLSQQWDNKIWAMLVIWALGSFIIWRLKRFHICATYALSFIAYAFVRALISDAEVPLMNRFLHEVAPITGPMYQLFIFFMITDPKSTVTTKRGQMVVAFLVATMEMILRLNENQHAPYYALFLVGPAANLAEIWWESRRKALAPAPAAR